VNLTTIGSLATLQYLRWGLVVTPLTLLPALALLRLG